MPEDNPEKNLKTVWRINLYLKKAVCLEGEKEVFGEWWKVLVRIIHPGKFACLQFFSHYEE